MPRLDKCQKFKTFYFFSVLASGINNRLSLASGVDVRVLYTTSARPKISVVLTHFGQLLIKTVVLLLRKVWICKSGLSAYSMGVAQQR